MGKKGQFVPVFHLNTLGDLTGLLNYNCRVLDKRLTKLTRRNRSVRARHRRLWLRGVGGDRAAETGGRGLSAFRQGEKAGVW